MGSADSETIYLVTGANRGIGKQMVADLLLRPSAIVIATVRDAEHETSQSLHALRVHDSSRLIVFELNESSQKINHSTIGERLHALDISYIDTVVANAATAPPLQTILDADPEYAAECFNTNSTGVLKLFQAVWPFLEMSDGGKSNGKKFVLISSTGGSIEILNYEVFPYLVYGMSKAAANYLVKTISVQFKDKGLRVGIIHPGLVKTDMGNRLIEGAGLQGAGSTVEESAENVLKRIDELDFDTTHGKFTSHDGQNLPW